MKKKNRDKKASDELRKGNLDNKTIAKVEKAKESLSAYLKKNKLDANKDWSKDKKHGAVVSQYLSIINAGREKIQENSPKEEGKTERKAKKVEKGESKATTKYDYPLVDGKEMNSDEKRKYRAKMRKEAAGDAKPKKEKEAKTSKKVKPEEVKTEKTKDKKPKKTKVAEKSEKKDKSEKKKDKKKKKKSDD